MGNNNGDPSDDISYRNGTIAYNRTERAIYQAAITCEFLILIFIQLINFDDFKLQNFIKGKLTSNDVDLFASTPVSRMNLQENPYSMIFPKQDDSYEPAFIDELPRDPRIVAACNNNLLCISDATISGLDSMGKDTKSGQAAVQNSVAQISKINHNYRI
jgi:hypothetical protein